MELTDFLGIIIIVLLWDISQNIKELNNNLIQLIDFLHKDFKKQMED